ncbi:MAG: RNA methyltransferase [Acholeplasmataceae bacterium]|jgi:TrmH family RNA methyltransferase|nr:RNA methyltransferase [Acholeplasmataceae bacterium]
MMIIESQHNPIFKELMRLKTKKGRKETGCFLVEGEHLVLEAIQEGLCVQTVGITNFSDFSGPQVLLSSTLMKKLADTESFTHVLAVCRMIRPKAIGSRVLLLDGIQDPGNLGTLIRSAKAFGFDTVIAEDTVDLYNSKVIRATQGALFGLNYQEGSLKEFHKTHPEYLLIGTAVDQGTPLWSLVVPSGPLALLLGNEGQGVRQELLNLATLNVTIEMEPRMESINVGVAGGILMYHLSRKENRL